jgi:hypothetical protein
MKSRPPSPFVTITIQLRDDPRSRFWLFSPGFWLPAVHRLLLPFLLWLAPAAGHALHPHPGTGSREQRSPAPAPSLSSTPARPSRPKPAIALLPILLSPGSHSPPSAHHPAVHRRYRPGRGAAGRKTWSADYLYEEVRADRRADRERGCSQHDQRDCSQDRLRKLVLVSDSRNADALGGRLT